MTDYQGSYRWHNQNSGTDRCECNTRDWYARLTYPKTVQSTTQHAYIPLFSGPVINVALPALEGILSHDSV